MMVRAMLDAKIRLKKKILLVFKDTFNVLLINKRIKK